MIDFIDKTSENSGTPINRSNLMAIQGFQAKTTEVTFSGELISIVKEIDANGNSLETEFKVDGSIIETYRGDKTITKKITFKDNQVKEVLL